MSWQTGMIGRNRAAHLKGHVIEVSSCEQTQQLNPFQSDCHNRIPMCQCLTNRSEFVDLIFRPAFPLVRQMRAACSPPGQIDRNTPQIERRSLFLAPQTVKDRTDDVYIVPSAGLPALGAFVVLLLERGTSRSASKYVAPPREDRAESLYNSRRKCDPRLSDLVLAGIFPEFSTSNRSPRGKR